MGCVFLLIKTFPVDWLLSWRIYTVVRIQITGDYAFLRTQMINVIWCYQNTQHKEQAANPTGHVVEGTATSFGWRFVKNKQQTLKSPEVRHFPSVCIVAVFLFLGQGKNRVSVQHFKDPNARSHPSPFPKWRE